ncbi:hypothetical protein O4H52_15725 [Sphingomonadaceae bacterium G21617-S1]|jgi:hypothetical protein|uniref:hypothetical protein n=1 Tax=Rhizorhabdus sp. TaxID=1968843 RepID=UPI0012292F78|nr:hypothetical protein [Rhizorhabdus sp.]MBD3759711.1 hypothetical protein [Rhizorhabdus sp.]MCZ4343069.1 hypothetical protein [Sphingomonadaceae bacterium G21617-S1]TAK15035.1 MAG: hypothetical protein EPO38_04385 [Rhizorhabdus sp.]
MIVLFGARALGLAAVIILSSSALQAAEPASRADAFRAADEAAGLAPTPEAVGPTCTMLPAIGEKLAGDMELAEEGHSIAIQNAAMRDALVKIRHADTGRLAASFFLPRQEAMTVEGVPDGIYRLQYAFGPALAPDCRTLTRIIRASQMPEVDELKTHVIDDDEHTEVKRSTVSYELSVTETANVKPVTIDAAAFNAE